MPVLTDLESLFLDNLKGIYHAEMQMVQALPRMAVKATSLRLRDAFEQHLKQTRQHVERLEEIFGKMGQPVAATECQAMEGLLQEEDEILTADGDAQVQDARIICAAQKVEHYEIASYGCLRTFATRLGHKDVVNLLDQTLEEEKYADQILIGIAENEINVEAAAGPPG